jgi:pre-mRNA-splicing factor CWC22
VGAVDFTAHKCSYCLQRLSRLRKEFQDLFEAIFNDIYTTIHRFEITKLRNVTRMFAHLFFTDAVSWEILHVIHLNEDETTSASRIFIKILFQELAEFMGLEKLYTRIRDP